MNTESARIHAELLKRRKWERVLASSMLSLRDAQRGLGDETEKTAKEKLQNAKVFAHLLGLAVDAMKRTADRLEDRLGTDDGPDNAAPKPGLNQQAEEAAQAEIDQLQKSTLRRIDQLLDALKPETGGSMRPRQQQPKGGAGQGQPPGGGGGGGGGANGDSIPQLAQLRALRALQIEVNEETKLFAKKHPDLTKLTEKTKDELRSLRKEQEDIANFFQELNAQAEPEGEKP